MKTHTSKAKSFYTQGQQFAAKVLFTAWLLVSGSPESALATPRRQAAMTPATTTSPGDPSLTSTPPTPSPGGTLQLPPGSPGSFWGSSAASTPSIDATPQRQRPSSLRPRTIDKLMGHLWSPKTQEAPSTLAGLVAEEAGSSSQYPTVDPSSAMIALSTATQSALQQLMSQHSVPDNNNLLAALNAAPPQEQRQWIEAVIQWLANQPIENLPPAAIRDYAALAHVQVTPENRGLLERYFHTLGKKVEERSGDESLIQALAYALAHLDPAIFAGDPTTLQELADSLLKKLDPTKRDFSKNDYRSARPTLEALSQALLLLKKVAPRSFIVQEGSLYQSFRDRMKAIADQAQYYPVTYHARILKQTLRLLEDPQIDWESNFRSVFQGLLGAANLVVVSQGLASLELKPAEFQEGIDLLQKAFAGQRIHAKAWYRELLSLEEKMVQCLQQQELAPYPEPAALEQQAQSLREQGEDLSILGQQSIQRDRKTFCFGIAMQLSTLALCGPTPEVRTGSIEHLIALVQPAAWGSDTNVMAGLLDGLALVAAQSQAARGREAAMAREALERLAPEPASDFSGQPRALEPLFHHPQSPQDSDFSGQPRALEPLFHHPQSPQDVASKAFSAWLAGEALASKLQRFREQTTEQAPRDEERLATHVKGTQRRTATIESFRAQEMANIAQLSSYILLAKRSHFVERTAATEQLAETLAHKGVCVLHGFGGAGKSTLAALYGHGRKDTHTVRWIGAENSFKLQEGYEQLAQELQVAYQPLAKKLTANASQYRQELARMVYQALEKSNQPTLLILDNAQDASLVADYLLDRPAAIQAIITTRSAEAFEGKYDQLQLGPFSQDQGEGYLEVRFKEMNRPYTNPEVASLLKEVGPVAQKLNLAAGYLQANKLVTTAQYIARLQALKQASTNQQSRLTLPEVVLGLETLTKAGQQLMQYAAYLDAYFIPLSLVSVLLGEDDPEQLSEVVRDLSRLSLMQVVSTNEGQEIGLQVHQEVQASCREYADWSPEAALGAQETILLQLARVLNAQMPWVELAPDGSWQQARLYAPHVATVVTALEDSGAAPSAVVASLLFYMGAYSNVVGLNYRQAVSFYERALATFEQVYQETPNHPDIASTLGNLGLAWSDLGDARQAVSFYERALAIYEQAYQEAPNHPDIASTLNNLGIAWQNLGDGRKAISCYERALAIFEQGYQATPNHPEIASTLNNLGIAWSDLGNGRKAISCYERALAIYEQVYHETPNHPEIASTLVGLGNAWGALGDGRKAISCYERALAIYEQVYYETPNHPDIASTLNNLGIAWRALGDTRQAVSYYQRALAIREQIYKEAPNHPEIAATLNNLGGAWRALGDARQAVSFLERALAIYEQVYQETPNHPDIAWTLNNLGNAWGDLGDARQAVSFLERALAIYERIYQETPNHPEIARTLNNLGNAWKNLGDARQAVSFLERALAIYEQGYQEAPNHPDIARTLIGLGNAWKNLGDTRQAVNYYERALAIYEQGYHETPNHPDIASTLDNLGIAWLALGDARQAVSFYERALAIYEQGYHETPNHPDIASTLGNLGNAWQVLGDARQAVSFYQRALAIYEQGYHETPNHPDIASTLNNLGNAWLALGDARQAVSFLERALAIREQVSKATPNHPDIASTLNNLGSAWLSLGDARQAVSYYERALAIYEQGYQATPNHPEIARTLNNLGNAWLSLDDARKAVSYYERALAIYEQVYQEAPNHPDIARNLGNLGNAWRALGDSRQAVSFSQRALAIFEQAYQEAPNHPDIASTLNNLGNAWRDLGDARQAVSFLERALAIKEQVYQATPNHPDIARTLNNLGAAWRALGDGGQAVSFSQRALAIYEQVYHETPNHPDIARTLRNLGIVYEQNLSDYSKALEYYQKALTMQKALHEGENHAQIAQVLRDVGDAYKGLGQQEQALEYYQQARQMQQALQ